MKRNILMICTLLTGFIIAVSCTPAASLKNKETENTALETAPLKELVSVEEAVLIIKENADNPHFMLLDVRTKAEYNEGHLKNATHHDYYADDITDFLLSLNKQNRYLIYCRTDNRSKKVFDILKNNHFKYIQYVKGGYTEWANKGLSTEKPDYEKILDILITSDKIKTTDEITFHVTVTDLDDNPIRKARLSFDIIANNKTVYQKTLEMNDKGQGTITVKDLPKNKYRLICTAQKESYQKAVAYYNFEVADNTETVNGSPEDVTVESDITSKLLKKFYNRNILGYEVYDGNKTAVTLDSLNRAQKPILIMFISPSCQGCMIKTQELMDYDLSEITVIPIITSVNDNLELGIKETEAALKELGLESIIPYTVYDAKDKIWFSRFKFSTTPKFILINKIGQIKDIIHGGENCSAATIIQKIEKIFMLKNIINKSAVQKKLKEFEQEPLTMRDKENTFLKDLDSIEKIREKIEFPYTEYTLSIENFSADSVANILTLRYYIEYKKAPQYKTKTIERRFYGFKKLQNSLDDEIAEMNAVLAQHGFFNISNISNITLEEFNETHIVNECTQYGYTVIVKNIQKNTANNTAEVTYYIHKNTNKEVRTEDRTITYKGFLRLTPEEKEVREKLKAFKDIAITSIDVKNTLKLFDKPLAESSLKAYFSEENVKIENILNEKPVLIGIGYYGCGACLNSWLSIAAELQKEHYFSVIELLTHSAEKNYFLDALKHYNLEGLKDHFYYYNSFPNDCRPDFQFVPFFIVADKNGKIKAVPKDIVTAFQMLKILSKE